MNKFPLALSCWLPADRHLRYTGRGTGPRVWRDHTRGCLFSKADRRRPHTRALTRTAYDTGRRGLPLDRQTRFHNDFPFVPGSPAALGAKLPFWWKNVIYSTARSWHSPLRHAYRILNCVSTRASLRLRAKLPCPAASTIPTIIAGS